MVDAAFQQAIEHHAAGRHDQAASTLKRFLQRHPDHTDANVLYAQVLADAGALDQAAYYIDRAIRSDPHAAAPFCTLGMVRTRATDHPAAAAAYRRAAALAPDRLEAWWGLGSALEQCADAQGAEEAFGRALAIHPWHPDITCCLARILTESGRPAAAIDLLRDSVSHTPEPGRGVLLSVLAFTLLYTDADPGQVLDAHLAFGRLLPSTPPPKPGSVPNSPDPQRRLRIGYISSELRSHPVAQFLEPVLAHHDPAAFEVLCYHTGGLEDETSRQLRSLVPHWRQVFPADGRRIREVIGLDKPDLLVDLSGHTSVPILAAMSRHLAPIQAHYIGYPCTTGVPSIDARIVDSITDPPGADQWAVERLVRLPGCFLCYQPPREAPEPRMPSGPGIVFGSFNNPAKISDRTVNLWAHVVSAVPGSRLVLKGKSLEQHARRMQDRFARAGLDPSRVECLSQLPSAREHLDAYSRIDIALDPTPYNGTTTTCEALWMGVPVVTLEGSSHAARVSASLLTAAGLPEFIVRDEQDYARIAAALAADHPRRHALRSSLRPRLAASRLCDGPTHARALEAVYRRLWRDWCTGRPIGAGV